jgi:endonuclease/exonuclease/phosphatase family metal-dependent hydrolase
MTANVRLDEPQDGKNAWLNRRELLVKTFKKYQPDILGCQELSPAQGAYVTRELGAWYERFPRSGVGTSSRAAGGNGGGGTASSGGGRSAMELLGGLMTDTIASINTIYYRPDRFEILDGESGMVLPEEPQATASENTFFSLAVLRERREGQAKASNPGTLIVVDAHFRHNEAFAVRCAKRLAEKIGQWEGKYPQSGVVVMGDINWDRTSKLYAAITAEGPAGMLVDAFDYAKVTAKGGSYHGFTGQASAAWPTDLIFIGGNVKTANAAEMIRDKGADGRYPTDHFLVQAHGAW